MFEVDISFGDTVQLTIVTMRKLSLALSPSTGLVFVTMWSDLERVCLSLLQVGQGSQAEASSTWDLAGHRASLWPGPLSEEWPVLPYGGMGLRHELSPALCWGQRLAGYPGHKHHLEHHRCRHPGPTLVLGSQPQRQGNGYQLRGRKFLGN